MLVNIAIGVIIFGYAGWSLFKFIKKSKEGKCASCSIKDACKTNCNSYTTK